jgi:hypothetical protein
MLRPDIDATDIDVLLRVYRALHETASSEAPSWGLDLALLNELEYALTLDMEMAESDERETCAKEALQAARAFKGALLQLAATS